MKIINKYKTYVQNYGGSTENNEPSATNKTRAAQTEVKNIVEMYGMESLVAKWTASEPLYADMTQAVTVDNMLELRQKCNEYFENMPARARKIFGDNPDLFYEKYKNGEFGGFVESGAMTEEMVDYYTKKINTERAKYEREVQQNNDNSIANSEVNTNNAQVNSTAGTDN